VLNRALADLGSPQFGVFFEREIRALDERCSDWRCGREGGRGDDACSALAEFVAIIERDQERRHPKIPADLASSWIASANAIESSLGCGTGVHDGHHKHDDRQWQDD
jgi:hypothetical protein